MKIDPRYDSSFVSADYVQVRCFVAQLLSKHAMNLSQEKKPINKKNRQKLKSINRV